MYSFIHVKSLFLLLIPGWLTYTSQTGATASFIMKPLSVTPTSS